MGSLLAQLCQEFSNILEAGDFLMNVHVKCYRGGLTNQGGNQGMMNNQCNGLFGLSSTFSPSVCLKVLDVLVHCHSALCRQFSGELVCSGPLEAGGRGPGDWTVEAAGTASHPTPANHSTASRAMPQHCLQQPSIPCCLH